MTTGRTSLFIPPQGDSAPEVRELKIDGKLLRVFIRRGTGTPLLIFNGIGASFELLEPLIAALNGAEIITFDVPGIGGSEAPSRPYRLYELARLADRLLTRLGCGAQVDVLGISWGGALAQQFARTCGRRCRRLILAATTPGVLMVPSRLAVLRFMLNARRYRDLEYLRRIAPELYGGALRRRPELIDRFFAHLSPPGGAGYFYQQLAFMGWTSLQWLPLLRQPTLVLSGKDDPLAPQLNGRILAFMIPRATFQLIDDGHLFVLTSAQEVGQRLNKFLQATR